MRELAMIGLLLVSRAAMAAENLRVSVVDSLQPGRSPTEFSWMKGTAQVIPA